MVTSLQVFAGTSTIASRRPASVMAKGRSFRGNKPRRGSRCDQRDRAGVEFEYANDHRRAQPPSESGTVPRVDASTHALGRRFHGFEQSHGTHRRSSYIPPHERRKQSPSPFPSSPPHVFHCDHRYKAIIREIYRDGSILQQKMERLLAGSSRLTPNEDEMDWEAGSTIYSMPCKPCLVTQNQTDGKTRGFEDKGSMDTDSDTAKIARVYMPGPQSRTAKNQGAHS